MSSEYLATLVYVILVPGAWFRSKTTYRWQLSSDVLLRVAGNQMHRGGMLSMEQTVLSRRLRVVFSDTNLPPVQGAGILISHACELVSIWKDH